MSEGAQIMGVMYQFKRAGAVLAISAVFAMQSAQAQSDLSDASALSLLPVAVSVAAPVMILAGGVALTVVSVQASAVGTVIVLELASDGARATLRFSGRVLEGSAVAVGSAIMVTALSTGYVLSTASEAIAFVPNEIGRALLYNERISY
jgi:zona occludens toxin (predicted ATPase)